MKKSKNKTIAGTRLGILLCSLLLFLFLLTGCGVYSKVPPVNPDETPNWSGPLLQDADMENVRIYIRPNKRTITLDMESLDGDLRILLAEYNESNNDFEGGNQEMMLEELSVKIPQSGNYVLVIEKTNP